MKNAQPFATRYPLTEVQGSYGTLLSNNSWAAPRYTSTRLSEISDYLFSAINKNTIDEWRDNYDDTEKYPAVLPSIGFYNIVNGTYGLGIGVSSAIYPTNLKEVNKAIIKLIKNPEVSFDEIYCSPDFPTGGLVLNGLDVKAAMERGYGGSVKMRAKMTYDPKDNCFIATEIPYMVFTNTICGELEAIINDEETTNVYFERFNDLTGKTPLIKIYLKKGANLAKAKQFLYNNTSLQHYFPINMIMLDKGRFPKVFSWREALLEYIKHIRDCKTKELSYDLRNFLARKHIVEGLKIALVNIDKVINMIKAADSAAQAEADLITNFGLSKEQTKAILAMRLSSLTKMDGVKLDNELAELIKSVSFLEKTLSDSTLLDAELIKALEEVAKKFGDERRTTVYNKKEEIDEDEEEVAYPITLHLLSNGMLKVVDTSEVKVGRKGNQGYGVKIPKGVKVLDTLYTTTTSSLYLISKKGRVFNLGLESIYPNTDYLISDLICLTEEDSIVKVYDASNVNKNKWIFFFTERGYIKKAETAAYKKINKNGAVALTLKEDDNVILCDVSNDENDTVFMASSAGNIANFAHGEILSHGKAAVGVVGIILKNKEDKLADAFILHDSSMYEGIFTLSNDGRGKITSISEFPKTNRGIVGVRGQKLLDGVRLISARPAKSDSSFRITCGSKSIVINQGEIPKSARTAQGAILFTPTGENENIKVQEV